MWQSLFMLLSKSVDFAREIFTRTKTPADEEESAKVEGSESTELGRASGKAAYEASKLVGPKKP
jgi:hypothetical protein